MEGIRLAGRSVVFEELEKARRTNRRLAIAVGAASLLAMVAGVTGIYAYQQEQAALEERNTALIAQSRHLADLAREQLGEGDAVTGSLVSLAGLPDLTEGPAGTPLVDRPYFREAERRAYASWFERRERTVLAGHTDNVISAAFSPDGSRIVTGSWDGTVRVWDAESGGELAVLAGHTSRVWSALFSSDGRRIVTASEDGTARVWDAESGTELTVLTGHTTGVTSALFSSDGSRIITASWDGTARLWDAESGGELAVLAGHTDDVWSASFSPDDRRIVTVSSDGTARLWQVFPTTQALVDAVKKEMPRCLSPDQREVFYLPAEPPRWCITGAGLEAETNPDAWQPKWPYQSDAWRDWLAARDRG